MKIYKYIAAPAVLLLALASCSKESPFEGGFEEGTGRLVKSAIDVDLRSDEVIVRSGDNISVSDFNIALMAEGEETPYATYVYKDMPEIITLPAGNYTVKASYGDDAEAGLETPYYEGESEPFRIIASQITENIGDVVCRLQNVKVTVSFDPKLTENMSEDTYVAVRLNESTSVILNKQNELNEEAAYFKYVEGGNLNLTFNGTVEGWKTIETKVYENVENGTHYKVTFKLHNPDPTTEGNAGAGVKVDATVTTSNVERDVDEAEDEILPDDRRPQEGDDNNGGGNEDPVNPNPDIPDNTDGGPSITAQAPLNLDGVNVMTGDGSDVVVLNIHSDTGFVTFTADIVSPNLTTEEMQSVGLDTHLDLVNPGNLAESLDGLGLPINVGGKNDVVFNISTFIPLLAVFGPGQHDFVITASDSTGTTVKTLTLKFN